MTYVSDWQVQSLPKGSLWYMAGFNVKEIAGYFRISPWRVYEKINVEIQFKHGERQCINYEVGENIPLPDGIHFGFEGCFVVSQNKIVAIFGSEIIFMFDKWGNVLPFPDIDSNHPFKNLIQP